MTGRGSQFRARAASTWLGFALLVVALTASARCARDDDTARASAPLWAAPTRAKPLQASARFTGTQLVVDNRGADLWRDVEIMVGRASAPPAYRYRADAVLGGRSISVGALNFERPDGTRWSPFQTQPDRWAVVARLPDGEVGFAEGALQ